MTSVNKFGRRDWTIAALLFVVGIALRVPFRSQLAYHWDGAEFALAVQQYNVALSQPHAPGYFLYVMLGRLVNLVVGDPHAGLVWISVVFGSALPGVMYLLGTSMFGRRTGAAAAVFATTSPQVWFHSCVALTYVVDSFLICVTVMYCWRAMNRGGTWSDAIVIGALLAVVGGVRQQSVPALVPLILFTFWKFESHRFWKLVTAAAVSMALAAGWFIPMVRLSGGLPLYLEIVRRHTAFNAPATLAGGGWEAFRANVAFVGLFCWNGLGLGAVALAGALAYRVWKMNPQRKLAWDAEHALALQTLAAWIAPMILMTTAVGFTKQPGYVLSYLPGLMLLSAVAIAHLKTARWVVASTVAVCALNALAFLAWPAQWENVFWGLGRTATEIRTHDAELAHTVEVVRATFDPDEAAVCHVNEHLLFGIRQFGFYLPEFDHYEMALDTAMVRPDDKPIITLRNNRLDFVGDKNWTDKRTLVLVVPPGTGPSSFEPYFDMRKARLVEGAAGVLYTLPANARRR